MENFYFYFLAIFVMCILSAINYIIEATKYLRDGETPSFAITWGLTFSLAGAILWLFANHYLRSF